MTLSREGVPFGARPWRRGRGMRRGSLARGRALALAVAMAAGAAAPAGALSVLTYNVAGLPQELSGSSPATNTVQISPRLNAYDLAAVQEDFVFHDDLISQTTHPHVTPKDTSSRPPFAFGLGDGLNRFSRSPFAGFTRATWSRCFGELDFGSDCLTPKGLSFARHEVAPGVFVDVYNLHADAGGDPGSVAARQSNLRQLADAIGAWSAGRAVIVLGDTNSRYTRGEDILPEFLATTDLTDVWIELAHGGVLPGVGEALRDCDVDASQGGCEVVDKIFYRSGGGVELTALDYAVPLDWVDAEGEQLSDHLPVAATFGVQVPEPALGALLVGGLLGIRRRAAAERRSPGSR